MAGKGKKLINAVDTCVVESLRGLMLAFPHLSLDANNKVVLVKGWSNRGGKVALVSGGGSGHEPFCAGYVGSGMLTAAVAGSVFTSPPPASVQHAIECVTQNNSGGVLVVIANYTGDVLNFGLAVERARNQGLKVDSLVVAEDCSLLAKIGSSAGRRGLCGLVFVYKIGGALAEIGKSLEEIVNTTREVTKSMATIGVGLSACSLPGAGPLFKLPEDEMELGLGVHGEAGVQRMKLCSAAEAVSIMLDFLTISLKLVSGDVVAVLVNNLGGTSQLEQWLMAGEFHHQIESRGMSVARLYAGPIMTSLEMAGIQVSLLKVTKQKEWLDLLDAETTAPAWPGMSPPPLVPTHTDPNDLDTKLDDIFAGDQFKDQGVELSDTGATMLRHCLKAVANALINVEHRLNELDSGCGDGDCGSTLRQGCEAILRLLPELRVARPVVLLLQLAAISESQMGGTSGGIYSLLFTTASTYLQDAKSDKWPQLWGKAWESGLQGVMRYSTAKPGDRTLLDALVPAWEKFASKPKHTTEEAVLLLKEAVYEAKQGCQNTLHMQAKAGRASYVSPTLLKDVDAGAWAVTVWLEAVYSSLEKSLSGATHDP